MGKTGCHTRGQGGSVSVRGGGAVARRGEQTAHRCLRWGRWSCLILRIGFQLSSLNVERGGRWRACCLYAHMHGQCSLLKEEKSS